MLSVVGEVAMAAAAAAAVPLPLRLRLLNWSAVAECVDCGAVVLAAGLLARIILIPPVDLKAALESFGCTIFYPNAT